MKEPSPECIDTKGDSGLASEIEHHLRYQTGTVHGAGKRIPGYSRGAQHGELLDAESNTRVEGGATAKETL